MISVAEALKFGESQLLVGGVADPRREAASLLAHVLKKERTFFYTYPEHVIDSVDIEAYHSAVSRRAAREPLQYITGTQEFFGMEFDVTPEVLIPRPETEMVVEAAIQLLSTGDVFCEVGSGSGCIAVAILKNRAEVSGVALDVSPAALEVTKRNAAKHDVLGRLQTLRSDVFAALDPGERFEMIVSNPPYVPVKDLGGLQAEVRDFEPKVALTDGSDGLSIIRTLILESPEYLRKEGYLLIEIGFGQSENVAEMFDPGLWRPAEFLPDLQGIPRLVRAQLR